MGNICCGYDRNTDEVEKFINLHEKPEEQNPLASVRGKGIEALAAHEPVANA